MLRINTDFLSVKIRQIRTTNPKILRRLERTLLRGFLCALCVLAVNAGQHFHREDAKDAKKTLGLLGHDEIHKMVKFALSFVSADEVACYRLVQFSCFDPLDQRSSSSARSRRCLCNQCVSSTIRAARVSKRTAGWDSFTASDALQERQKYLRGILGRPIR